MNKKKSEIEKKIEKMRLELYDKSKNLTTNFNSKELYNISKKLDKLINQYYNLTLKNKK